MTVVMERVLWRKSFMPPSRKVTKVHKQRTVFV